MKEFVYIYNLKQANFYINSGIKAVEIGVHSKTNKTYFKFIREETRQLFQQWNDKTFTQ